MDLHTSAMARTVMNRHGPASDLLQWDIFLFDWTYNSKCDYWKAAFCNLLRRICIRHRKGLPESNGANARRRLCLPTDVIVLLVFKSLPSFNFFCTKAFIVLQGQNNHFYNGILLEKPGNVRVVHSGSYRSSNVQMFNHWKLFTPSNN